MECVDVLQELIYQEQRVHLAIRIALLEITPLERIVFLADQAPIL